MIEKPISDSPYLCALRERVLVFDGAMGTSVFALEPGPDDFGGADLVGWIDGLVLHAPALVEQVHRSFLEVGADVVETCTFQSTPLRVSEWGGGRFLDRTRELNRVAAELARGVCDEFASADRPRFVAGSMGPTGFLPSSEDPSLGGITFTQLADAFAEQAEGLIQGGVDLLIVETGQDILEMKAAIFGCRRAMEATGRRVPVQAQATLDVSGRMLLGTDVDAAVTILGGLRVDVVGLNCSTGPEHMREPVRHITGHTRLPVSCLPNAGLPLNVEGREFYPLEPGPMADELERFVTEMGVSTVGGCCGTTPAHIRAIVERVGGRAPTPRPDVDDSPRLASSIRGQALHQEPRPLLIGERVNAQGSRRMKRLLLTDDYDGILEVARDQVEGGAHALDVQVALTERSDEAEQMRRLTKKLQMSVELPLVFDTTETDVVRAALETYPGRPIVNSINLEGGRARVDSFVPLIRDHGAAVIALTIDNHPDIGGMAKTRHTKLLAAQHIADIVVGEYGLEPHQLIFDALTFTLATGDAEYADSAVETIEGIRLIKAEMPGVLTTLGLSNVSFGYATTARPVLNSVFLHHCLQAGLDTVIINPAHVIPYEEIDPEARALAEDVVFNRREDANARFIQHYEERGDEADATAARVDPLEGLPPAKRIHQQILQRRKDGIEDQVELALDEGRTAVEVLNEVLLPAMKDVGDRFGAGKLILPFVLQSAEVMKRAVSQVEKHLDRKEGVTKGKVVLATVYGDVHDIGKNLVDTILSNNGYTVFDLGKQVPVNTIIDKAVEVEADVIGLSALLVSTSKQMPLCLRELDERELRFPVIVGGAAINRNFGRRILYVDGERTYEPGVYYCKDAFEGLEMVDQLVDEARRPALVERIHDEAAAHRVREAEKTARAAEVAAGDGAAAVDGAGAGDGKAAVDGAEAGAADGAAGAGTGVGQDRGGAGADGSGGTMPAGRQTPTAGAARSAARGVPARSDTRTDVPIPVPPFWGARVLPAIDLRAVYPHVDHNSLFKMGWGFKGIRDPEEWDRLMRDELQPRLRRSKEEAERDGYLHLAAVYGYWPALADGDTVVVYDPEDHTRVIGHFSFPRQAAQNRLCLADYVRPLEQAVAGERDVVGLQIVTSGDRAAEITNRLKDDGQYDDMLRVHGFSTQMAEATAEYVHELVRRELKLAPDQGRRYSWGYPACPDLEDHAVLMRIVPAESIGVTLTTGFQLDPEQSTAAIVMHHPQARYFETYTSRAAAAAGSVGDASSET